jgi:hypothetical protein
LSFVITPCACIVGAVAGIFTASSVTSYSTTPAISTTPIIVAFICLFVPIIILSLGIIQQCILAAIVDDCNFSDSLRRGFKLFGKKFSVILLASIILGIILFGVSMPVGLGYTWLTQKFVSTLLSGLSGSFLNVILYGIAWLVSVPVYMILSAIVFVFTQSAWTFLYHSLTVQPPAEAVTVQQENA